MRRKPQDITGTGCKLQDSTKHGWSDLLCRHSILLPHSGQSSEVNENGRHYGATARIRGVLDYVTLVGPNAVAGVISPEHAENVRRKCMSLLTTSEDMQENLVRSRKFRRQI